jgi:hypothetical protein
LKFASFRAIPVACRSLAAFLPFSPFPDSPNKEDQ